MSYQNYTFTAGLFGDNDNQKNFYLKKFNTCGTKGEQDYWGHTRLTVHLVNIYWNFVKEIPNTDFIVYKLSMDLKEPQKTGTFQDEFVNNVYLIFPKGATSYSDIEWKATCYRYRDDIFTVNYRNKSNDKTNIENKNRFDSGIIDDFLNPKGGIACILYAADHCVPIKADAILYKKEQSITNYTQADIDVVLDRIVEKYNKLLIKDSQKAHDIKVANMQHKIKNVSINDEFGDLDWCTITTNSSDRTTDWNFNFELLYYSDKWSSHKQNVNLSYDGELDQYSISYSIPGVGNNYFSLIYESENIDQCYIALRGILTALRYGSGAQKYIKDRHKRLKNGGK